MLHSLIEMRYTMGLVVLVGAWMGATAAVAQDTSALSESYARPPQVIVDILDAVPPPRAIVSPTRDTISLTEQPSMPSIGTLAEPMLRLAGFRINPRRKAPWRAPQIMRITLVSVDDGTTHEIVAPHGTTLGWVTYSPDGRYISYSIIRDTGVELWVAETTSGQPRAVTSARGALNHQIE